MFLYQMFLVIKLYVNLTTLLASIELELFSILLFELIIDRSLFISDFDLGLI